MGKHLLKKDLKQCSMNVEVWSSKEGKGYDFSEGKLDDEFDGSQSLHYWKLAGNALPNELVF